MEPPEEQNDCAQNEQSEPSPEELLASFPEEKLSSLNIKISSSRWVVPVLPNQELECLLNAAIRLTEAGIDNKCEPCMKFYRDGLTTSFIKILTDEAVSSWKYNIHHCILMSCSKLMHLIALHMKQDNPHLLNLLAVVLDPENKFQTQNASRQLELYLSLGESDGPLQEGKIFARPPPEPKNPRGWLVDLINRFGECKGFDIFLERINIGIALFRKQREAASNKSLESVEESIRSKKGPVSSGSAAISNAIAPEETRKLSLPLLYTLLRPFGQCAELLTVSTVEKYFMPVWDVLLEILETLSDDELKREAKFEGKNDVITGIVKYARALINRVPNQENLLRALEMCRLRIILRVLQISSFNGKMNALNEINKVLGYVSYYPHRQITEDEVDVLNAEKMAQWIRENDVIGIVLRDSLHQPQYVEKLEKILRFLIKEKSLTLSDLDAVWRAQAGKHEAIVKNVHDLLAKLAWDFNAEQLDHLFKCFQASMKTANKKQRERLLELNRRLAEDDKNGVMAQKVLKLFWTLAHSADIPPEVLDQALASHVKILDYSCSQERDAQKTMWLDKCVDELKAGDEWALPALRLIREICTLYETTSSHAPRVHQVLTRQQVIDRLQNDHTLVILVTTSLTKYMDEVRAQVKLNPSLNPNNLLLDKRYPHPQQIQERLEFLKFLLKDGQLWLCAEQAKQIWQCLAVNAVFPSDREECFRWFGKLMGDEPDLDPGINKDFFENNLLKLDPVLLTESGIKCFERFFKAVNSKEERLKGKQRGYVLDNVDLIGKDYLWRVITDADEEIAFKAIDLLKEVSTALGPRLQANVCEFHENFISECCDRLQNYYETVKVLTNIIEENSKIVEDNIITRRLQTAEQMCRVVRALQEYIKECDRNFTGERLLLPLHRASRGKHINLFIRFQNPGRQLEDLEVITHNNETIFSFNRNLLKRIKATTNNLKIDLFNCNGDLIEINDDRNPLSHYNIRDKTLITVKLTASGSGLASSPDSSSDSSSGSPPRPCPDMLRSESEEMLPGVIISQKPFYVDFFLKIYQLGSDLQHGLLRDSCGLLLHLLPQDALTVRNIQAMCSFNSDLTNSSHMTNNVGIPTPESLFIDPSPARVLYNLEVLHAMLLPALDSGSEATLHLQSSWLHCGAAHFILDLLTKNNFLPTADMHTKRAAFHCVLKLVKFFLYIVGCVLSKVGNDPQNFSPDTDRSQVEILDQAIQAIPGNSELTIRSMAMKLAHSIAEQMLSASVEGDRCRSLFKSALQWNLPDMPTIKAIVNLAWAASGNNLQSIGSIMDFSQNITIPEKTDYAVCKEALEVLCIALVLHYGAYEALSRDNAWSSFIMSLVLTNPSRHIRQTAYEQLFLISTYCASDRRPFLFMVKLLVKMLRNIIVQHQETCADYFQLFCRILNYGCSYSWPLSNCEELLAQEIDWLRTVRDSVKTTGGTQVHDDLLEGHLCLTKELMCYLNPEIKSQRSDLITEITDDYLFSASRQYLHLRRNGQILETNAPPPVCRNPHTISAACDLLVALCQHTVGNMQILVNTLLDMFCIDIEPLREWEYLPPVGPRPPQGFCGLKNAGATCYMNSVLQQLFMVPSLRIGILSAQGAAVDPNEDFSGEIDSHAAQECDDSVRKNYHVGILKYVQAIFAHLGHSALQYFTPRGLWSHFKLQGEPVNLREQQDAVEFFMSLFESLDEGLKSLGYPQLMGATLGGCFSDQKICQDCPHRYSKEEPFSVFSVDIRNHSSLTDSLEQYVKGEILEGADAYHCDKCDKKVVTVKRLCVRKLPPVLAFQLKRFEYDYERVCAIKFNDYFEFPRWLDMEPYTVSGLAKIEGEVIDVEDDKSDEPTETRYQLTGIVVHSGQASGGHYFSYILHKAPDGSEKWYKFDDGEVTECKMNEDEEMKAQCFGGDYMGEVYDNNLKRMQYRRQKRWWNAYMLFYTRYDHSTTTYTNCVEQLSLAESKYCILPMPAPIERSVRTQNIRFLHAKSLFSVEFFAFIKKLVSLPQIQRSEKIEKLPPAAEELSLLSMQLASQFLFHSGFRTKKTIRGAAIEWYETLCQHIRNSVIVRQWFAANVLLNPPTRLSEYILAAPSPEIRSVFGKLVVFFCHCAAKDDPLPGYDGSNLCEQVLIAVLSLLKGDVADYGKHLPQYFNLFSLYAGLGLHEKQQLIRLNVPAIFMKVSLDEGPGPQIKYQYPDLSKLHHVVSHLIRSCDVSSRCQGFNSAVKPNIYIDPHVTYDMLMPISPECNEYLFNRVSYVKRLIEDTNIGEEGVKLLQYCSWENPHFSRALLAELLWHCGYAYWHDMKHHTELLLQLLLIEDSWQHHRIHNAIVGVSDDREGLLDIIQRNKMNYQKRAYQCIKCLVSLFNRSRVALNMLHTTPHLARQWTHAVEWLQDELDRHRGSGGQYNYNSWSPPAQSNDNTNSFILERSQSAKNVLQMAFQLCPEEDQEEPNEHEIENNIENNQVALATTAITETTKHACLPKQQQLLFSSHEENLNSSPSPTSNVSKLMSKVNIHTDVGYESSTTSPELKTPTQNVNSTSKSHPVIVDDNESVVISSEKSATEYSSSTRNTSSPITGTTPNSSLNTNIDQQA